MVAKSHEATNTQVFLYLQSQVLYYTLALKSSQLVSTINRNLDHSYSIAQLKQQQQKDHDPYKRLSSLYKQSFDSLLRMISAASEGILMPTCSSSSDYDLGVYAFYNQENLTGLLACMAKQLDDYDGSQQSSEPMNDEYESPPPNALYLVKFVLQMLQNTDVFDGDVCVMLVNVLGLLLLKCDPLECDRIAEKILYVYSNYSKENIQVF